MADSPSRVPVVIASVFVALVVMGCAASLLYVLMFSPYLKAVRLNDGRPLTGLTPGDVIKIDADMRMIDVVTVMFSTTKGLYSVALERTRLPAKWTVPRDTFSDTCTLRVVDPRLPEKRTADSAVFAVRPRLRVTSDVMNRGVRVAVPGIVVLNFHSNSALVDSRNVRLQTSADGQAFADVAQRDAYRVFPDAGRIVWNLSEGGLEGKSLYLRVTTADLRARGYVAELADTTRWPVQFVSRTLASGSTTGGSSLDNLQFGDLVVRHDPAGVTGGSFAPHRQVFLTYTIATGGVNVDALEWDYSVDKGKTYATLPATVYANTTYTAVIPALAGPTIRFRIQYEDAFAVTPDFVCEPTLMLASVTYMRVTRTLQALVYTDGTLAQADTEDWEATLSAAGKVVAGGPPDVSQVGQGLATTLIFTFKNVLAPPSASDEISLKVGDITPTAGVLPHVG